MIHRLPTHGSPQFYILQVRLARMYVNPGVKFLDRSNIY